MLVALGNYQHDYQGTRTETKIKAEYQLKKEKKGKKKGYPLEFICKRNSS